MHWTRGRSGLYTPDRPGVYGFGVGMGFGAGFGGAAAVDPITAAITKYGGFWLDPDFAGAITLNTQPTADDWDMETADMSRWTTAAAGGTPSKETVSPYAGSRYLKVAVTGNGQGVYQTSKLISGCRYLVSAAVITDGSVKAGVRVDSDANGNVWNSDSPTTWTVYSGDGTCNSSFRPFINSFGTTSGWFGVDSLTISNLSITTLTPRLTSAAFSGLTFTQATAASMPWRSTTAVNGRVATEHAAADYATCSLAKTATRFLHYGDSTVFTVIRPTTIGTLILWDSTGASAANVGAYALLAGGQYAPKVGKGGGAVYNVTHPTVMSSGTVYVCAHRVQGNTRMDVWVNGGSPASQVGASNNQVDSDSSASYLLGFNSIAQDGQRGDYVALAGALSDYEVAAVGAKLASRWGGTWA